MEEERERERLSEKPDGALREEDGEKMREEEKMREKVNGRKIKEERGRESIRKEERIR